MCTDEFGRHLLVAVVKGHRRVEQVLEGFLELGLPGATVVDAKGMGEIVTSEIPIFSGFRALFPGGGEESYMVFSVLQGEEQVGEALGLLQDICGDFAEKGTGVAFTLPVTRFLGPR